MGGGPRISEYIRFPEAEDNPSCRLQFLRLALVSGHVVLNLVDLILGVCARPEAALAGPPVPTVPEITVAEDGDARLW